MATRIVLASRYPKRMGYVFNGTRDILPGPGGSLNKIQSPRRFSVISDVSHVKTSREFHSRWMEDDGRITNE